MFSASKLCVLVVCATALFSSTHALTADEPKASLRHLRSEADFVGLTGGTPGVVMAAPSSGTAVTKSSGTDCQRPIAGPGEIVLGSCAIGFKTYQTNKSSPGGGVPSGNPSTGGGVLMSNPSTGGGVLSGNPSSGTGVTLSKTSTASDCQRPIAGPGEIVLGSCSIGFKTYQTNKASPGGGVPSGNPSTGGGVLMSKPST